MSHPVENLFTDVLVLQALWMVKKADLIPALSADPTIRFSCVATAQKYFLLFEDVRRYAAMFLQLGVRV